MLLPNINTEQQRIFAEDYFFHSVKLKESRSAVLPDYGFYRVTPIAL